MHIRENEYIGIIGAPNSGKTTLFNWLTGSRFKTVNYPGSTVDYSLGKTLETYECVFQIMDTPGTYSLFPQSPDEEVTWKALFEPNGYPQLRKLIVVVDATQIFRHLYLARQAIEAGFQIVIALTMSDLIRKEKIEISTDKITKYFGCPVVEVDGTLGGGVQQLVKTVCDLPNTNISPSPLPQWSEEKVEASLKEIELLKNSIFVNKKSQMGIFNRTAKIDNVLLHPFWGYFIFVAVMLTIFSSIFWIAAPFMDYIDQSFSWVGEKTVEILGVNLLSDLLSNGIITSFAAVFVFVPQIFILFLGIGFLEDSGYLARASTLIDKPFSKLGMNGKSFVPILGGFACAVPAMMASRTLGSRRERFITMFIIPLMTCSARLPVFALMLTFLFYNEPSWKPGLTLTGLYIGALVIGAICATILNRMLKADKKSAYMIELPIYRAPKLRILIKNSVNRTQSYVQRAGPIIFVLALIIWTLSTFPNYKAEDSHQKLETSYAGQIGKVIEPVFEPMGLDWRAGVGLISAFAAREVFVSSLAVMFNVSDEDEDSMQKNLISQMHEAKNSKGELIFTFSSVIGIIIFFMIALQCISTTAIAAREMASWKFAIIQLVVFNVAAYVLAVAAVNGLRAFGID